VVLLRKVTLAQWSFHPRGIGSIADANLAAGQDTSGSSAQLELRTSECEVRIRPARVIEKGRRGKERQRHTPLLPEKK
jgi:hypothetical protein